MIGAGQLFGVETAKRRPGYANRAIEEPPLKLVVIEGEDVVAATTRLIALPHDSLPHRGNVDG